MYEYRKGMGWSDLPNYPACGEISGGGIKRCFTSSQGDVDCAQGCGCRSTSTTCRTTGGSAGTAYCCPRDCPTPEHGCVPQTRNLICDLTRVDINALVDSRSRAVWRLKNNLCARRIDPGAVNGVSDARLSEALSAFQSREGLPATGQADAQTLYRLGFTAAEAQQYSSAVVGTGQVSQLQLPWALIAASSAASMFMIYAVWKFTRRPR